MPDTTSAPRRRLTRAQAAEYLGVQEQTLAAWASTGRYAVPFLKVGSRVYYDLGDLDAWLDSRRRTQTPASA